MKKISNVFAIVASGLLGIVYFVFCIPFAIISLTGKLLVKIGDIRDIMNPVVEKALLKIKNNKNI